MASTESSSVPLTSKGDAGRQFLVEADVHTAPVVSQTRSAGSEMTMSPVPSIRRVISHRSLRPSTRPVRRLRSRR